MQTELVSSRDLSSPEGLRGNQTEYSRQASLIPLVRLKSHAHTLTHTHARTRTHKLYLVQKIGQENRISLNLLAFVHLCLYGGIFSPHPSFIFLYVTISKTILHLKRCVCRFLSRGYSHSADLSIWATPSFLWPLLY